MSFTLEKHLRVYNDKEVVFIQVRPCPDAPEELIRVETVDKTSQEWYGKCCVSISKEEAKLLAKALLEIGEEQICHHSM